MGPGRLEVVSVMSRVRYPQVSPSPQDSIPFHGDVYFASRPESGEGRQIKERSAGTAILRRGFRPPRQARGEFCDAALSAPADYWRCFLFLNAPESSDTSFTGATDQRTTADTLNSFVNRVLSFLASPL